MSAALSRSRPKPLTGLMGLVITALTVSIIASSVSIIFDIHRVAVIDRIQADIAARNLAAFPTDEASARSSDHQTALGAIFELLAVLAAAASFIAWFYRAYANLPRMGIRYLRRRRGWAIASWFVPVLAVFWPKRIANDIWRGSDPTSPDRQPNWHEPVASLLHWWWALFLLDGVLGQLSGRLWNSSHTPSGLRDATNVDIASAAVSIGAAVLAALVVYRITARQAERINTGIFVSLTTRQPDPVAAGPSAVQPAVATTIEDPDEWPDEPPHLWDAITRRAYQKRYGKPPGG